MLVHRLKQMVQGSGRVGQNGLGGFSPDEGFGVGIVFGQISIDRRLQVDDRAEDAAADTLPRHLGEEVLHRIEPGRRGRVKWKIQRGWRASQANTPAFARAGS